ncbi:MAG TPA: hypothetical protein VLD55_09355 [Candidatus Sulfobium mesophilum]|nr:hypothetical protein [Candidatus Sulfobium mesophilum]
MRVLSVLMYGLPIAASLFIFSCGQKMSDDEAKKIINQYLKYPHPLFNGCSSGPAGSADFPRFIKGIEKLKADGYLKEAPDNPRSGTNNRDYLPADKGRDYMTGIYVRDAFVLYNGAVCNEVIRKIEGVDMEKDRVATIRFATGYEPVQPFYSLLCLNDYCECFGERLKKVQMRTIRVRKYERGWRLAS